MIPMKRFLLPLALAAYVFVFSFTAGAMNNKDVIRMHKAGLSEDTILTAMQKEKAEYDTGTDALIELKTAGISEKIIQGMIKAQSGGTETAAPAAAAASGNGTGAFWQEFPSIAPATIDPVVGKDYFTRYTFRSMLRKSFVTNTKTQSLAGIRPRTSRCNDLAHL